MNIVISLVLMMGAIFADDNADIGFRYGFLSKSPDDSKNIKRAGIEITKRILPNEKRCHLGRILRLLNISIILLL